MFYSALYSVARIIISDSAVVAMAVSSGLMFLGEPLLTWASRAGSVERVIVFLHGSGDSGKGVSQWLESLNAKSSLKERTAVLFPSARARPYSMYGGERSRVWHDRRELHISAWEDREGIADMASRLDTLISQVCQTWQLGRQRVALGGFRETSLLTFSVYFSPLSESEC